MWCISDSFVVSVDFGRKPFVFSEDTQGIDCLPPLTTSCCQSESLFVHNKQCTSHYVDKTVWHPKSTIPPISFAWIKYTASIVFMFTIATTGRCQFALFSDVIYNSDSEMFPWRSFSLFCRCFRVVRWHFNVCLCFSSSWMAPLCPSLICWWVSNLTSCAISGHSTLFVSHVNCGRQICF